jgi:hypothetical protein
MAPRFVGEEGQHFAGFSEIQDFATSLWPIRHDLKW